MARAVADRIAQRPDDSGVPTAADAPADLVELAELAADLFTDTVGLVRSALKTVADADVLVVATPAYKGHYTGLLKSFLDLLPGGGLTGTVAVPVVVAASPEHRVTAEAALRVVLDELAAVLPVRSFTVVESRLGELDGLVDAWAAAQLPVLRATVSALAPPTSGLNGTRPDAGSDDR